MITKPIAIGDHCWIAAGVFVAPGVTVEEGSMISAGAVVTRDVGDAGSEVHERNELVLTA